MSMEVGTDWNRCIVCGKQGETSLSAARLVQEAASIGRDEVGLIMLIGALECGWGLRSDQPLNIVCPEHAEADDFVRAMVLLEHVITVAGERP